MRRIPFYVRFAWIPILEVRSDSLAVSKFFEQVGKLHLAIRIGFLERFPLMTQLREPAKRHRAVFPSGIEQANHIGSAEQFRIDKPSGANVNVIHVEQVEGFMELQIPLRLPIRILDYFVCRARNRTMLERIERITINLATVFLQVLPIRVVQALEYVYTFAGFGRCVTTKSSACSALRWSNLALGIFDWTATEREKRIARSLLAKHPKNGHEA